jgi:hypothetical protein
MMKNLNTRTYRMAAYLALPALLAGTASSHADIIAQYDFETESNRLVSSDLESSTTASDLVSAIDGLEVNSQHTDRQSTGDSLTFDAPVSGFALVGSYGDIKSFSNSLTAALTNDQYIGFSISLDSASSMDLTSFSFATDITSGTADKNYWLLADQVGGTFETGDAIGSGSFTANGTASMTTFSTATFSSNTEFRLYFDTDASTSSHGFAIDNIALEGNLTPVPEPSTLGLLAGVAALGLLRRRRV